MEPGGKPPGQRERILRPGIFLYNEHCPRPPAGNPERWVLKSAVADSSMATTSTRNGRHINAKRARVYHALLDPPSVAK
jgi:hypothetical protein